MIVKRIRQSAKRQQRPLREIGAIVRVLSSYVMDASMDRMLRSDGENALAQYVLDAQGQAGLAVDPGEKVHVHGTRCLVGDELVLHQQQMIAANLLAPGAKDPVEHYVSSWQTDEMPTTAQVDEAVDIFAQEMGYGGCQIIWATHANTANYHLHLVVNRIDLERRTVVSPGDGWEIDRLHQVTALIEDRQGWAPEPNAIYNSAGGEVRERATGKIVRRADGSRLGCGVRKRTAPERGQTPHYACIVAALRSALTWQDLHNRLVKLDASYRPKGSGAEIKIGDERMKATDFGRAFAFGKMTKKLGEYRPDIMVERDPYEIYQEALRAERKHVREALNATLADLRSRRKRTIEKATVEKAAYEAMITEERLNLRFDLAEAAVKESFDLARMTIAETFLNREAWHKAGQPDVPAVALPQIIFAPDIRRDEQIARGHGLHGREHYHAVEYPGADDKLAITDYGVVLIVHRCDKSVIEAALAMGNLRGDGITVEGSRQFLELCREIAEERGYTLLTLDRTLFYAPATAIQPPSAAQAASQESGQGLHSSRKTPAAAAIRAQQQPDVGTRPRQNSPAQRSSPPVVPSQTQGVNDETL